MRNREKLFQRDGRRRVSLEVARKVSAAWAAENVGRWRQHRDPFATRCKLFLTLTTESGAAIPGCSVVLEFAVLPPYDGAAVLMYDEGRPHHLGRFDFGAAEIHSNTVARAAGVRGLEGMVRGSHVHPYRLNEPLGRAQFLTTRGKPPAACAINDSPPSFRQRMRLISQEFRIDDLDKIPPPLLQGDLWR